MMDSIMGNLIKDKSEDIAEIKWTVTGKVSDVTRTASSQKPDLHFDYDAMGQRIAKTVTNKNVTTGDKFVTTYYVRGPHGSVLAGSEKKKDAEAAPARSVPYTGTVAWAWSHRRSPSATCCR